LARHGAPPRALRRGALAVRGYAGRTRLRGPGPARHRGADSLRRPREAGPRRRHVRADPRRTADGAGRRRGGAADLSRGEAARWFAADDRTSGAGSIVVSAVRWCADSGLCGHSPGTAPIGEILHWTDVWVRRRGPS